MRRISLALALIGAVAATGCGNTSKSNTGGNRGVAEGTFKITVQNGQNQVRNASGFLPLEMLHGRVTSDVTGIDCAAGSLTGCEAEFLATANIVLTAAPVGTIVTDPGDPTAVPPVPPTTVPAVFLGWAGDCQSVVRTDGTIDPTCTLTGASDKYVLARFGKAADATYHGNWSDPAVHGPQYWPVVAADRAGTLDQVTWNCFACHGSSLQGTAIAVSCQSCHSTGMVGVGMHEIATGHTSGTCARCHTGGGMRDYIGLNADGTTTDDHLAGFLAATPATAAATQGPAYGRPLNVDPTTQPVIPGTYYSFGSDGVLGTTGGSSTADSWNFDAGILCNTCHNPTTVLGGGTLNTILFAQASAATAAPFTAGKPVTTNGIVAICGQCHTGQRDGYNVAQLAIQIKAVAADTQLPTADNKVVRAHYLPAASTLLGSDAAAWYQFPNGTEPYIYTQRNQHGGKATCSFCHDPHTGALPADSKIQSKCGGCHFAEANGLPVTSFLQLEESRQFGFGEVDVDGNGTVGSLKAEIDGLGATLFRVIRLYATNVATASICIGDNKAYYDNGTGTGTPASVANDGVCQPGEMASANEYKMFTPRLLKAVFNYLMYQNDPGAWAHNPRYAIEVLFDTITDMNSALGANAIDFQGFRGFEGHFGGVNTVVHLTETAHSGSPVFHDWDSPAPSTVGTACAQCHGGQYGMDKYLARTGNVAMAATPAIAPVPAFECTTCHAPVATDNDMKRIRTIPNVYMPGQKEGVANQTFVTFTATDFDNAKDMICASCHSGRENKNAIDVKNTGKLATDWSVGFTNPHYLGAMGVLAGSNAHMMYEYGTNTYAGWPINKGSPHGSPHGASCNGCHRPKVSNHSFEADLTYCGGCHVDETSTGGGDYRLAPLKTNVDALAAKLYATIQAYAMNAQTNNLGAPTAAFAVCYNGGAYPYWFKDNGTGTGTPASVANDGICQPGESVSANGAKFNPAAAKAAFNYKWSQAEPGAYAHNYEYMVQALIDSTLDLDPAAVLPIDAKTGVTIVRP